MSYVFLSLAVVPFAGFAGAAALAMKKGMHGLSRYGVCELVVPLCMATLSA
jgi:hypothetical protein